MTNVHNEEGKKKKNKAKASGGDSVADPIFKQNKAKQERYNSQNPHLSRGKTHQQTFKVAKNRTPKKASTKPEKPLEGPGLVKQRLAKQKVVARQKRRNRRPSPNKPSWKEWNNVKVPQPKKRRAKNIAKELKQIEPKGWKTEKELATEPWYSSAVDSMLNGAIKYGPSILEACVSGFGDYEVQSNSLLAAMTKGANGNTVPMMENSKNANIIHHREYLGDIYSSSSSFQAFQLSINPGLFSTFPWVARVANSYTAYRMRGLIFEYVQEASELATAPGLGYVALATQYNSVDVPFSDKVTMLNSMYATSGSTAESKMHPVECAANQVVLEQLYVRSQGPPEGTDLRLYDMGQLTIAVGGQSESGASIGELWATYEVEFYQPKNDFEYGPLMDTFTNTGWTNNYPMGVTQMVYTGPQGLPSILAGIYQTASNTNQIIFANEVYGNYRVEIRWVGTSGATLTYPTYSFGDGVSQLPISPPNGFWNYYAPNAGDSSGVATMVLNVNVMDTTSPVQKPFISIVGGGSTALPGSPSLVYLTVIQVPVVEGDTFAFKSLTRKGDTIFFPARDKFRALRMENDESSSDSSEEEEENPLDILVRMTDGLISDENQLRLVKIFADMVETEKDKSNGLTDQMLLELQRKLLKEAKGKNESKSGFSYLDEKITNR